MVRLVAANMPCIGVGPRRYLPPTPPPPRPYWLPLCCPARHGSTAPPPRGCCPCLCCRRPVAGGPPRPTLPWWLPRLLLCCSPVALPASPLPSMSLVSLLLCCSASPPLLSISHPPVLLPCCAVLLPRCLPLLLFAPAVSVVSSLSSVLPPLLRVALLQQPKGDPSESLGDVHRLDRSGGSSSPVSQGRTGGIREEGRVFNRALTGQLLVSSTQAEFASDIPPPGCIGPVAALHGCIVPSPREMERNATTTTRRRFHGPVAEMERPEIPSRRPSSFLRSTSVV